MTNVEALKNVYVALGGSADDVAEVATNVEMLRAIFVQLGGDPDAVSAEVMNAAVIDAIADVANGFIKPSGTISITENGNNIDVADYATANVSVDDGSATIAGIIGRTVNSVTIPNGVDSVGDFAFYTCAGLTSVTIPDSVLYIKEHAFGLCQALTSITLPPNLYSIGASAFNSCIGLTSITIPGSVTSIGNYAFDGCSSLTSIVIPVSVTNFGQNIFRNAALTDIYYTGTQAQWEAITGLSGAGIPQSCTIHYEYTPTE